MPGKRNVFKWVAISVSALLVLLVGGAVFLFIQISNPANAFSELRQPEAGTATPPVTPAPTPDQSLPASETPQPTVTPEPTPEYKFEQQRVNILLLGADSSVERVNAGMNFRTDTMILVTVDFANKDVDMISIPRDSYVRINGGERKNKINAAFVFGGGAQKDGYAYACTTVEELLGVPVDYYVGFGMNVVKDVVNAMGGVEYDVDIAFTMNGRRTEKGLQHMDGQKVLDYCRFRKGGRGDVDRVDRQQRMLFTIFETMLRTNQVVNIPKIYQAVAENIDTNLNVMQIATLAYFAKDLSMDNIGRHTIPGNGQYVGSTSYYLIYQDEKNQLVKEIFGVDGPFDESMTVDAILAAASYAPEVDETTGEVDLMALTLRAQEMEGYINDYGDLSSSDVQSVLSALRQGIEEQDASAMLSALSRAEPLFAAGPELSGGTAQPEGGEPPAGGFADGQPPEEGRQWFPVPQP